MSAHEDREKYIAELKASIEAEKLAEKERADEQRRLDAEQRRQKAAAEKEKAEKWLAEHKTVPKMMGVLTVIAIVVVGFFWLFSGNSSDVNGKATSPLEVYNAVHVGMTSVEAMGENGVIDQRYFIQNKAFAGRQLSELWMKDGVVYFEITDDLQSPYYGWFFFGSVVEDVNPTLVGLDAASDTVAVVARLSFDEVAPFFNR